MLSLSTGIVGPVSACWRLVVADRWCPSSKTCSRCKTVKAKLSLSERTYRCEHRGRIIDRDRNAAANLASRAEAHRTSGTASGAGAGRGKLPVNAQGEERFMGSPRCSSTNGDDGTSPELDETATWPQLAPKPVLVGNDR